MTALVLALLAALSYGVSDFVGGLVSRRSSAWPVAVLGSVGSTVVAAALALFVDGEPTASDLVWATVAGVGSGMGVAFLYRGFSSGRMSVVAPVSGVGAALVPVVFGVVGGERPGPLVWLGILAAVPAIWLVSAAPDAPDAPGDADVAAPSSSGLVDGVLAGLGFGLLFGCLGQVPDGAGLWPVVVANGVSVPAVVLLAVGLGSDWVPRQPVAWLGLLAGPFGGAATLLFLLATQQGLLTVASVLTALYPAFTVLLAMALLRERVHARQALGLLLCGLTVVLVAGG